MKKTKVLNAYDRWKQRNCTPALDRDYASWHMVWKAFQSGVRVGERNERKRGEK